MEEGNLEAESFHRSLPQQMTIVCSVLLHGGEQTPLSPQTTDHDVIYGLNFLI